ncbi:hypothetical protein [Peribacillus sp. ACCC06369]|uniref:hypothetical protein n=1 Tax=Peribacillus sp. ACCC06369 TaxID=3055860 RepID=UPI00259FEF35|nr:hypothetical protein [Peribacillus sp. ACCC06369]
MNEFIKTKMDAYRINDTFKPTRLYIRLVGTDIGHRSILLTKYKAIDYHGVTILIFG